ncbi:MAG TPA: hypothetical protein VF989_04950 [Polyangiaceae bacterium]|jgi:hypothetical protein
MAEPKRPKKLKSTRPRSRYERRFQPEQTRTTRGALVAGLVGSLVLGAGVYGLWVRETPLDYASYLVALGALVLAVSLWVGEVNTGPFRVGDVGVAKEKGSDLLRVLWCDVKRIHADKGQLVVEGEENTIKLPLAGQSVAAAWVLKEAARRVPDALDVKRTLVDELPEPKDSDGESLLIGAFQVAGRHCAATDKPIAFERDARLCPNCAEAYLKDHVPKRCATCGATLTGRAYRPTG